MVALTNQAGRTGERSERRAGGQQKQRHREKKKNIKLSAAAGKKISAVPLSSSLLCITLTYKTSEKETSGQLVL